jgi:hypothetical protein
MAHLPQLEENMPLRTANQEQVRYTLSSLLNLFFISSFVLTYSSSELNDEQGPDFSTFIPAS